MAMESVRPFSGGAWDASLPLRGLPIAAARERSNEVVSLGCPGSIQRGHGEGHDTRRHADGCGRWKKEDQWAFSRGGGLVNTTVAIHRRRLAVERRRLAVGR